MSSWPFYYLLSFILGIALKSFWGISWLFFFNITLISIAVAILSYIIHKKPLNFFWFLGLLCIFVSLGILRIDFALSVKDELKALRDTEETVFLKGKIIGEPDIRDDNTKYTLKTDKEKEKILISVPLFSIFNPGDEISLKGKLQTPIEFSDFNYREYLEKDGIKTVSYYPKIELIKKSNWTILGSILKIKNILRDSNKKILPTPQSELLGAMILGDKQLIPEDLKDSFSKTGLSHVTAISGMHITIIASLLMTILAQGNKSKKDKAFYLVLIFLFFYIVLVGFPPSAVRAGIMTFAILLAEKVRRQYFAPRALTLAATGILLWNPLLLRFDVGFQLSFLAVLGIIYLYPFFNFYLSLFLKSTKLNLLKKVTAMTLGAQISTLPILIYNFGIFSGSAPITNVLVVPLLPFVIGFGFMGIAAGVISQTFGVLISFPVYILLSYIIWLSNAFKNLSISGIEIENFHYSFIIIFYIVLAITVFYLKSKIPKTEFDLLPDSLTKK